MNNRVATGLAAGRHAIPALALDALEQALAKLDGRQPGSLLLLMSREFQETLEPSLRACARRAGCTRIIGTNGPGVLTEDGAVLDQPACAVMVFTEPYRLDHPQCAAHGELVLGFATPQACDFHWLQQIHPGIGLLTSPIERGGRVWSSGRHASPGRTQALISGVSGSATAISRGLRQLTPLLQISRHEGARLLELGDRPALEWVARCLPYSARESEKIPLHDLMLACPRAGHSDPLLGAPLHLLHITRTDPAQQMVELSEAVEHGQAVFFVMRDAGVAERDTRTGLAQMQATLPNPAFALLFSSVGRGPVFHAGRNPDLELFKSHFPNTPLIGCQGQAELAPLENATHLFQYTSVFSAFV